MIEVPEFPLDIHRGDTRPLAFEFRTGVNTTVPAELTGSSFELRFSDALGARVLTVGGTIADRVVVFGLTLEQRALLAPGSSGRFVLARLIDGNEEIWGAGPTHVTGG